MAAVNFPNSPTDGQTFTHEGKTYTWSASSSIWERKPNGPIPELDNFATTGKAIAMAIVFGG